MQPFPPGLYLLVGQSPDPRPLPGGDPCLVLTRSLKMLASGEVTIHQAGGNSQPPACLPPWTHSQHISVLPSNSGPWRHEGWSPQGLKGSQSYSLHLLLSRVGPRSSERAGASPGKKAMHAHTGRSFCFLSGRLNTKGQEREGPCLIGAASLRLYPRGSGHGGEGAGHHFGAQCVWVLMWWALDG